MNISDLVKESYETAKSKGWHDKPATFGDRIALCHSELSEALEAYRELDNDSFDAISQKLFSHNGVLTRDSHRYEVPGVDHDYSVDCKAVPNKPEGVWSELADVVIRIADMCGLYGIDLNEAIEMKMAFNKTRPYRHGGKQL